jgi:5-methylcytosine-specific restriction endonuclease McrA
MNQILSFSIPKATKKICTIQIDTLMTLTNLPSFQRVEDETHTDAIYLSYERRYIETKQISIIGQISLSCIVNNPQKFHILDGQHRLNALNKLMTKYPETKSLIIDVCLYECENEDVEFDIYTKINANKQVPLDTQRNLTIMREILVYMTKKYKDYIKPSAKPQCPNINIYEMEKQIKNRGILEKIETSTEFINSMEELNKYYQSLELYNFKEFGMKDYNKIPDYYANKNETFYPSLYRGFEWVERIKMNLVNKIKYENMKHNFSTISKEKIPKKTREQVWKKRNGDKITGNCFCCKKELSINEFQCAHIIARYYGGTTDISNLEPTCGSCNRDMATMNLQEYMNLLKF